MTTIAKPTKLPEFRFPLGQIYLTRGIDQELPREEVRTALARHARGDWGLVCAEDREANEQALIDGARLLSAYAAQDGRKIWVITEADRSATTVLFPEEY